MSGSSGGGDGGNGSHGGGTSGDDGDPGGWRDRGRKRLDWLVDASAAQRIAISVIALAFAVAIGGVLVFVSGFVATCRQPVIYIPLLGESCYNPAEVYWTMLEGSFGSLSNLARTLQETTLLLFTGLSVAVAFRAGLFNVGTQGQMVLGGLATGLILPSVGPVLPDNAIGTLIALSLGLFAGAAVGGFWGMIPGAMKSYADANEVITTIMLNFVATGIAFYLVSEHLGDPGTGTVQTVPIPSVTRLSPAVSGSRFSIIALVGALLVAVAVYLLYERTVLGYELRTSGLQESAAEYSGVDAKRNVVTSMTLSGALGGIAGTFYVMMVHYRWQTGIPSLGFDGIAVSVLAGNNPLGIVPAALLFGSLKSGSFAVDFSLGVPNELIVVLRGLIILFVAMPEFFRMLGTYFDYGTDPESVATDGGENR